MPPDTGLSALPVTFTDLFEALGTGELRYGDGARRLSGREIAIDGFLSQAHGPHSAISLVPEPGVCPDCSAIPVPVIALPDLHLTPREGERPVRIVGRLDFGLRIVDGIASMLRIESAALLAVPDGA